MALLFLTVIVVYSLVVFMTAHRIGKTIGSKGGKVLFYCLWTLLSYLYFIGRFVSDALPEIANRIIYIIGSGWLIVMLYSAILIALLLIGRFVARLSGRYLQPLRTSTFVGIGIAVVIIIAVGVRNAYSPVVTRYKITCDAMQHTDTLRIAFASDLHIGLAIRSNDMERLAEMINASNADICIIGGDFFDGDTRTVVENDLGAPLSKINCRLGTFGVLGNHDHMADATEVVKYLKNKGITILCDSAVDVGGFRLIGREDLSVIRHGGGREALKWLTDSLPTIVVDHQPAEIDESVDEGALLHLSGHTHAGQVFPMNFATRSIYDIDYGKKEYTSRTTTTAIVTSGFGTWGPRIRLGNMPEIVIIDIVGSKF